MLLDEVPEDLGRGAPPDGISEEDGIVISEVLRVRLYRGTDARIVLLDRGAALAVMPVEIRLGVLLFGNDFHEVESGELRDLLRCRPGVARCREIDDDALSPGGL